MRIFRRLDSFIVAASISLLASNVQAASAPSMQKLWKMIQEQQKQIEALKKENKQLNEKIDINAQMTSSTAPVSTGDPHTPKPGKKVNIGGYGELHYNNLDSKKEIDFHRFVLFFGHEFTSKIRFFSELELEHALSGEGKSGEVELEQAYVEMDLDKNHSARAGVFLVPVGILNETHEPDTFYGVERNPVEKNIIPSTWWEAGIAVSGRLQKHFSYDLALTSGLATPTTGSKAYLIRSGRQKVAKAKANDGAITARLKWTGMPGLELALTAQHQSDLTQGQGTMGTESSATLLQTHAVYQKGPFALRALYAQWKLGGSAPASLGRNKQTGWYIEPSYKFTPKLGVFARYNEWDNNAGDSNATLNKQSDFGLNFWPHENVVLKLDIQRQSGAASDDGFNLGVGYQF